MSSEFDDVRLAEAFARAFTGEPAAMPSWATVRARAVEDRRPARRLRREVIVAVVLGAALLVPAALLAARVWTLTLGAPAPRPVERALLRMGQPFVARDVARTRVVARMETSRGMVYLLESPSPHLESRLGPVKVDCLSLLYGFPTGSTRLTRIQVSGHRLWFDRNATCGGVAPSRLHRVRGLGAWGVVDAQLSAAYGQITRAGVRVEATLLDGQIERVPTWHGYYIVATADGAQNDRVVALTARDRRGRVVATLTSG